jgi:hypothetical protein
MNCEPHIYGPGELDEEIDTLGVKYPDGFFDEKPKDATPQDPNELRDKPNGGPNNNAPQPDKTAATLPATKPEVKTTPTAKPAPPTTSGKSMLPPPPPATTAKPAAVTPPKPTKPNN